LNVKFLQDALNTAVLTVHVTSVLLHTAFL